MKQVIIIGSGPAGITAAIELKRNKIDPLLISKDLGALGGYHGLVENYYGFDGKITGDELAKKGVLQAKSIEIDMIEDSVISISEIEGGFLVKTERDSFSSQTVLLATGKQRQTLDIPGYKTFKGKGISLCAACDGYFFRKKKIAVVGYGPYMLHELAYLNRIASDVSVFTHGHDLEDPIENPVIKDEILKFVGNEKITHIETKNGLYEVGGVFIAIGTPTTLTFALQLGILVENNNVKVDQNYMTNIPGLFAAGDMIGGRLQIVKASYDGMMAAESIIDYLEK
jgi:thioredoxin reductase (NADPH)